MGPVICVCEPLVRYNAAMNESDINALTAWLAKAGPSGEREDALVSGFCDRAVAAGLPISRAQVFIDTLHPVYEGRLVRWGYAPSRPVVQEYGRTGSAMDASAEDIARWRAKSVLSHVADRQKHAVPPSR